MGLNVNSAKYHSQRKVNLILRSWKWTGKHRLANEVKYSGLILDHKCLWSKHELEATNKTKNVLMMGRRFARKNLGIQLKNTVLDRYNDVKAIIIYGSVICSTTNLDTAIINFSKVQRLACIRWNVDFCGK